MRNSAPEPVVSDIQTTQLSLCPQMLAGQHSCGDRDWPQYPTGERYQCYQRVTSLFEEINSAAIDTSAKDLGLWLSKHKEALRCCEALLMCSLCRVKPAHMVILALLADRLIIMCDEVISTFLSTWAGNMNYNINGPQDGAWLVCVGSFEIDSPLEWGALISNMLAIQLRKFGSLMVQFQNLLWNIECELVRTKADLIQNQISTLLAKISAPQPD